MSERGGRDDDWIFDPEISSMARQMRRELREEAREVEADVATTELRGRLFADVALEARNRGDIVAVAVQRRNFQGLLRYAGHDFLTVQSPSAEVDVNLAAIDYLRTVESGRHRLAGRAVEDSARAFELRLLERESPVERVEIGFRFRDEALLGHIVTVGQDHVIVADDQRNDWAVPTHSIAFVVRRQQKTGRR